MNENKIKFGLSNVHVWPIESVDTEGKPTYGSVIKMPGGIKLTMNNEETSEPFYADNVVYHISKTNNGYSGDLELALIPIEFEKQILGQTTDANGVLIERTNDKEKEFAMAFQFEGDKKAVRHLFPRVSAGRPAIEGETKENTTRPTTETISMNAVGRLDNNVTKLSCAQGLTPYETWYEAPYEVTLEGEGA